MVWGKNPYKKRGTSQYQTPKLKKMRMPRIPRVRGSKIRAPKAGCGCIVLIVTVAAVSLVGTVALLIA